MNKFILYTKESISDILNKFGMDNQTYHIESIDCLDNFFIIDINAEKEYFDKFNDIAICSSDRYAKLNQVKQIDLSNGNWGLDRIDQRSLPLDNKFQFNTIGSKVDVYVIDSGIYYQHTEFGIRAIPLYDDFRLMTDPDYGLDILGHGTAVSSIIGGNSVGVARGVGLKSVRVFVNNTTTIGSVLNGIAAVIADHTTKNGALLTTDPNYRSSVANLSFNFIDLAVSPLIDAAIANLISSGITTVVSAGNNNEASQLHSPASTGISFNAVTQTYSVDNTKKPLVCSASNKNDKIEKISPDVIQSLSGVKSPNFGPFVDIFAPGDSISSANMHATSTQDPDFPFSKSEFIEVSGTSASAAHGSGVAALLLDQMPGSPHLTIKSLIISNGSKNVLDYQSNIDFINTPNLLLFSSSFNKSFNWITPTGNVLLQKENSNVGVSLNAASLDELGNQFILTYSVVSDVNSLFTSGVVLNNNGVISGVLPAVMPNVVVGFPGILGKQFVFTLRVTDEFGSFLDRTFDIVVASVNQPPKWNQRVLTNLNDMSNLGAIYKVKTPVSINIQNLSDSVGIFPGVSDPDIDPITFSLLAGSLPTGITISPAGIISGIFGIFPYDVGVAGAPILTDKTYQFTLRATDGNFAYSDKSFMILVRRDITAVDNLPPAWITTASTITTPLTQMTQAQVGNFIFQASDPDGDPINYQLLTTVSSPPAPPAGSPAFGGGVVTYGLPPGIVLTNNTLSGIVSSSAAIGQYWFDISITDGVSPPIIQTFNIKILLASTISLLNIPQLVWQTSSGSLGMIDDTYASNFELVAITQGANTVIGTNINPINNSGLAPNPSMKFKLNNVLIDLAGVNILPLSVTVDDVVSVINLSSSAHNLVASNFSGKLKLSSLAGSAFTIADVNPPPLTADPTFIPFTVMYGLPAAVPTIHGALIYSLVSGSTLPAGLSLTVTSNNTANIDGVVSNVVSNQTISFTVRVALASNINIFNDRVFSILVKNTFSTLVSEINIPVMGDIADSWEKFHNTGVTASGSPIIDKSFVFKLGSSQFGIQLLPMIYLIGGTLSVNENSFYNTIKPSDAIIAPISTIHKPADVVLGDIKKAIVLNPMTGTVVYEVLYYEVNDINLGAGGFETGVRLPIPYPQTTSPGNLRMITEIFPTSLSNRRTDFNNKLTIPDIERLPAWMRSEQIFGDPLSVLGFVAAVPVVFLKPGFGDIVLSVMKSFSGLQMSGGKFSGEVISIDRYLYTKDVLSILSNNVTLFRNFKLSDSGIVPN